ncbi:MAG: RNA methyltransferase [Anaerolineales bacterium]|nr:RNA methyltransferase [Anaerolineales bacterium]
MFDITSHQNAKIKQVRALGRKKERASQGMFVVEGIRHVGEAAEAGANFEFVLYAPDLLTSEFANELISDLKSKDVPCYSTDGEALASVTDKENPQGLLAVIRWQPASLTTLSPDNFNWGVALVASQDPGNVGTILRTLDAAGADGLLLLDNSVDPTHSTAVRASMGTLFWKPVVQTTFEDFATWTKAHGYHVYGTSAHGSLDYRAVKEYKRPSILLLGSEREGLNAERIAVCEQLIKLPMGGRATSLNLAVAAGILIYQMIED